MSARRLGRRRVLKLVAAGAAALRAPSILADMPTMQWRGSAMGAEASLTIRDPDRRRARTALAACIADVRRMERIFSLHRRDSALTALNAAGFLADPPAELVDVLRFAADISAVSAGAFDVTVQPLWEANVLGQRNAVDLAPALERARALVGWRRLAIGPERLGFAEPGMAATLNGIAQGYATDRVAERLRDHGFPHVLVDLGELRAIGERGAGQPWRIGVEQPDGRGLAAAFLVSDQAVATSSPRSAPFNADGTRHHLFDPRTGSSAQSWASVSVVAPTAMRADALSTAIAVSPPAAANAILTAGGGAEALLVDSLGRQFRIRG